MPGQESFIGNKHPRFYSDKCHNSSINAAFLISSPVRYYLNTNNIDIVVIFISSTPSNSTAYYFANLSITMMISSTVFELFQQVERKYNW